jgi:(S)-2-hydroxyglutarate dehydrogenase
MSPKIEIAIIGGGIVGLAIGLELTHRFPAIPLVVIEKESVVAGHQTSHNSGVIHSGIYYKPGSLKAKLSVEGSEALLSFCKKYAVPYNVCGKIIIATSENELPQLEELYRRGKGNRLKGLRMLTAEGIRDLEPHATGIRGIHVPSASIVDYGKVARKYANLITDSGGTILVSHEVTALWRCGSNTIVETTQGPVEAQLVINCAGLHSDRISRMAKANLDLMIVPFRGEYYDIIPTKQHYVTGLIYPVPDPRFPFLGAHFTKRIGGGVEAGPNAVLALKREGYSKKSFRAGDVFEYAMFPGFWRMAAKHWKVAVGEFHRSWSKAAFVRSLQRLIPELVSQDLDSGGSGVRAQALGCDGNLIDDFHFVYTEGILHVSNVPSPAATASLAIARYIVDMIVQHAGGNLTTLKKISHPA